MATAIAAQLDGAETKQPEPLPLIGESGQAAPYPVAALGPWMKTAVQGIAALAYVPPSMAAASVLSAASLALQGHADVRLPTGQYRPISLFMVTVAESGDRKSTADEYAMRAVSDYQRELNEEYAVEKAKVATALDAWNETRKATITSNKSRGRDALADALAAIGPKPAEPMEPVMVARSGTTQGLIKLMEKARPSIGLMSDEGGFGMTDDARLHTISTLSDCWDGKPLQRLTAGEGSSLVYGRRLTFHLMVQPSVSARLMGDPEAKGQGFLSRILPTQPESLAGTRIVSPGHVADPAHERGVEGFRSRLAMILRAALPFDVQANALRPRYIALNEEATARWWAFYNECELQVGPGGDLEEVKGFVGKIAEQAARLAANLALFEQGVKLEVIDADIMERAIILARFYLSEAARMIGVAPVDQVVTEAHLLSNWLRDKWPENLISLAAAGRFAPNQLRKLNADRLRRVMEVLERNYHVSARLPNGGPVKGKHAAEVWRVTNRARP
jgi:Protein of unknown function (DUF3987)